MEIVNTLGPEYEQYLQLIEEILAELCPNINGYCELVGKFANSENLQLEIHPRNMKIINIVLSHPDTESNLKDAWKKRIEEKIIEKE